MTDVRNSAKDNNCLRLWHLQETVQETNELLLKNLVSKRIQSQLQTRRGASRLWYLQETLRRHWPVAQVLPSTRKHCCEKEWAVWDCDICEKLFNRHSLLLIYENIATARCSIPHDFVLCDTTVQKTEIVVSRFWNLKESLAMDIDQFVKILSAKRLLQSLQTTTVCCNICYPWENHKWQLCWSCDL